MAQSLKQEALERYRKALSAREGGRITEAQLLAVESEVLEVPGVDPQNVKDIKKDFRDRLVKNRH
jgi:hypothetical protein